MIEKTLFIIKPDGFPKRKEIISEISDHFNIEYLSELYFSEALISELYFRDIGKSHYPALIEYIMESPCELGIIKGENSIEKFFRFAGENSDPRKCKSNTLRFKYGKGLDKTKSGLYIIKNGIHRAESKMDSDKERSLLQRYGIL